MGRLRKGLLTAGALALALGTVKWFDPAIIYHTFPPVPAQHRVVKDFDGKQFTHGDLEKELSFRVRGEYTDSDAVALKATVELLRRDAPGITSNVHEVVILPKQFDVDYSGQAGFHDVVLSSADSETITHEIAHIHSRSLPASFWKEWTAISSGHYKHEFFPLATYIRARFEHAGLFRSLERVGLYKYQYSEYKPRFGFMSDYGEDNPDEDLAEHFEAVHKHRKEYAKVNPAEIPMYEKKVDLLHRFRFISAQLAAETKEIIGLSRPDGVARFVMKYKDDIPAAHPVRFDPYGMTLYESKDHKLSITYGAFRDAPHLYISVLPAEGVSNDDLYIPIGSYGRRRGSALPRDLHEFLKSKGYLSQKSYMIQRIYPSAGESKESMARRENVAVDEIKGPVPSYDPYSETENNLYYVYRQW
jgi:hypothetical protein